MGISRAGSRDRGRGSHQRGGAEATGKEQSQPEAVILVRFRGGLLPNPIRIHR
ncbi:uncharacterized protein DS421_5g146440 [Arachis hypogaea]|nr:uncharacterized protein DS421_5g146440 [Arachis hypogaea]